MKTLEELRNEVMANEELKRAFSEALLNGTAEEFVLSRGVTATKEEIDAAISEFTAQKEGELSDEEMENVAGGNCAPPCPSCGRNEYVTPLGQTLWQCGYCKRDFNYIPEMKD